jgi:methylase of polypeptide subunit release factors
MSAIPQASASQWAALADRFRAIGLTSEWAERQEQSVARFPAAFASEWLRLQYAVSEEPAAIALRMLARDEPVGTDEAQRALGNELFAWAKECGLIEETAQGWRSPLRLFLLDTLYILGDRPEQTADNVMGIGTTTALLARASYPDQRVGAALDLGCGGGVLGLLLARAADRVVGTDLNARAIEVARVNAMLNGITNAEFRVGDWFAPVAGERFDLIVSQPPFIPLRDDQEKVVYLHGGRRGDEMAHLVVEQMPAHLTETGIGFVLADMVTVPEGVTALKSSEVVDLEVDAAVYCAQAERKRDRRWWDEAHRTVEHLRRCGVQEVRLTLMLLGVGGGEQLTVAGDLWASMERAKIDALWVPGTAADWLEQRARIVEGTTMEGECRLGEKVRLWTLRSGSGSLRANPQVGEGILDLIRWVTRGETLGACVSTLSPADQQKALGVVDQLVRHGILEMV